MKFTNHQEKIVEAIIDGKVYDIPSYLKYFNKAYERKYDINQIKSVFEQSENGRTYMFRADSAASYCTDVYDNNGQVIKTLPILQKMTYTFRDYPISTPVSAQLNEYVEKEIVKYNNVNYTFDFLNKSYMVADNFDDIVDFITLWAYLKREALILEVNKTINSDDIGIFFEIKEQKINPDTIPKWEVKVEILSDGTDTEITKATQHHLPTKDATYYIDKPWKFNYEHLITCSEFIDKKIIASSELRIFKQNKFKTVEQISQKKNLFVAWLAVAISVISIIIGNIMPLFQPKETDYLEEINQHISIIEKAVLNDNKNESIEKELNKIKDILEKLLQNQIDNNPTSETKEQFKQNE